MDLNINIGLAKGYKSKSQIARVLTEDWVVNHMYCPCCGKSQIYKFENNRPVADLYCNGCNEEFELKSKNGKISKIIVGGAHSTMIERINSDNNPNLFFLTYTKEWKVSDFLIIPKQFFTTDTIIKRSPLAHTAKRAGWIGCNINLDRVADIGKIFLVKENQIIDRSIVQENFNKTLFLRSTNTKLKGWLLDMMNCLDLIHKDTFSLDEIYRFESILKQKYPMNNFVKDKIRQQLQILRDREIIEFLGKGRYKKVTNS